jgi:hypothetical protein
MKCLYYVVPTLVSTHDISDDLQAQGVKDFFIHVISQDEAGLKRQHVHSSNYLETLDVVRDGLVGGIVGLIVGAVGVALLRYFDPIGVEIPDLVAFAIVGVATLFGAWEGGLIGVAAENHKIARFHDEIEAGNYLVLIYAFKEQEERVKAMMSARHPEARLAAVDRHFINPFRSPTRGSDVEGSSAELLRKG